jgi:hypothetical protein
MIGSVEDVTSNSTGGCEVTLVTETGVIRGLWADWAVPPEPGTRRAIELDLDGALVDFLRSRDTSGSVQVDHAAGVVSLNVLVESVDADGLLYVRVSPGCLFMLEAEPGQAAAGEWLQLAVPVQKLLLVPQ